MAFVPVDQKDLVRAMPAAQAGGKLQPAGPAANNDDFVVHGRVRLLRQTLPGVDDRVRVERQRQNALVTQPLGQVRVVAGPLPADTHILAGLQTCRDRALEHEFHGLVAFVEISDQKIHAGVAVQAQRELGQVVGADGEAVKVFQELIGKNRVGWHFAHHDQAQAVFAARKAVAGQQIDHTLGLWNGTHEGNHDFHVGQAHFIADFLQRLAFHSEALGEVVGQIARRAAEAQHRVFFFGFIARATNQLAIFVGFEIGQADNDRLGVEGGSDGADPFRQFLDEEGTRAGVSAGGGFHRSFQFGINVRVVQHGFGVNVDVVVNDEFQSCKPDAVVGNLGKIERQLRVADVHHDLHADIRHFAPAHFFDLGFKQTIVNAAFIAFRTRHCDFRAIFEHVSGVGTAHNGGNTQFAGNDGGVAGAPAAVGHDGRGQLHDGFPVGVGHVSDKNVSTLDQVHLRYIPDDPHRTGTDFLADRAPGDQHIPRGLQAIAFLDIVVRLLRLDRFGTGLKYVDFAVDPVTSPFDVHGTLIVVFNNDGITCQFDDFFIGQRIAVAL